jgi:hypothetical protein
MNSDYMNADAILRAVFYNFSDIPDFMDNRGKFWKNGDILRQGNQ